MQEALRRGGLAVLLVTAGAAVGWGAGQADRWTKVTPPTVVAGPDLGFRVEWMDGAVPTGTLVVRAQGKWVEARLGAPQNLVLPPAPPSPPNPPR